MQPPCEDLAVVAVCLPRPTVRTPCTTVSHAAQLLSSHGEWTELDKRILLALLGVKRFNSPTLARPLLPCFFRNKPEAVSLGLKQNACRRSELLEMLTSLAS